MYDYNYGADEAVDSSVVFHRVHAAIRKECLGLSGMSGWSLRTCWDYLARVMGVSASSVEHYYYGISNARRGASGSTKVHDPSPRMLLGLSVYFGVPMDVWFAPGSKINKTHVVWGPKD